MRTVYVFRYDTCDTHIATHEQQPTSRPITSIELLDCKFCLSAVGVPVLVLRHNLCMSTSEEEWLSLTLGREIQDVRHIHL